MYHGLVVVVVVVVVVVAASEGLSSLLPMMLVLLFLAPESMIVDGRIPVDVAGIGMTPLRLSPPLPIVLEL
jgi:hypothetical protein